LLSDEVIAAEGAGWAFNGNSPGFNLFMNPRRRPIVPGGFDPHSVGFGQLKDQPRPIARKLRLALLVNGIDVNCRLGGLLSCTQGRPTSPIRPPRSARRRGWSGRRRRSARVSLDQIESVHRHRERSEAIQAAAVDVALDRFAALAMTRTSCRRFKSKQTHFRGRCVHKYCSQLRKVSTNAAPANGVMSTIAASAKGDVSTNRGPAQPM